ncbi:hypothetical protein NQ317_009308 [Molorchus minor]|uniref:Uncharacterized protein n=1 Tax=Molorchus minor TaxID=1323400 RepID=A0ABQ9J6H3_9CUCU|nr:hypothetical protein NQ317_009308 [Molorchus minor]
MGKFLPVFLTFILQLCGVKIFRDVGEQVEGPLAATYIFLFAIFLLLWDIRLYPNSLRKLGLFQYFVEFLIAQFLFENILLDFWFPLEVTLLLLPLELASTVEEMLTTYANLACGPLCEGLRDERAGLVLSYVLSVFFLIAVLHATRAIDLRELE